MEATDIQNYNVEKLPSSSFNLIVAKRRSGKSVLIEYMIKEMVKAKMLDLVFLFSPTDAGFDIIDEGSRFKSIDTLMTVISNYKGLNDYNKKQKKNKNKIRIRTAIVIDDFAVELKSKNFNILETLAVLGRHYSYDPLSLHFFILSQSLTKIPRVVRLNSDIIMFNAIASAVELDLLLMENFYLIDGTRDGRKQGRQLYNELVVQEDYIFVVVDNSKQNCRCYSDYIYKYKAIL